MKSCKTCRWCSCREYGNDGYCNKYIPDLSEVHKADEERERQKETRTK